MADHFYAISPGASVQRQTANVTVGTTSSSGVAIELRVTDGACRADQVYDALEFLADLFATKNVAVVVPGTLTG